jgi:hypothetical protein
VGIPVIKTLKSITASIELLTDDGHLPEPGTLVVTGTGAMIFPELPGAPISGLIVWALHLAGPVDYQAEVVFRSNEHVVTSVTATGKIDGIDVTIAASTHRHTLPALDDQPEHTKIKVTENELRELGKSEEVLGQLQ